ncbi:MAG: DEAD/DEAH box helicase [Micrococcus sp.]|nr:DEAD/DEAH box helicase [Micrococcus sp.]
MASDGQHQALPRVDTRAITAVTGTTSAARGLQYALQQRVGTVRFDPATAILSAQVSGNDVRPYRVRARLQPVPSDASPQPRYELVAGVCTCPVGTDCKHVAAVVYRVGHSQVNAALGRAGTTGTTAPHPSTASEPSATNTRSGGWRDVVEPLAGLTEHTHLSSRQAELAIGVELVAESARTMYQQWGPASATEEQLRHGRGLYVALRPLRRGAKGAWIRGGLTWKQFQFSRGEFRPAQERALRLIYRQLLAEDTYPTESYLLLNAFDSPRIWQLLADARAAGVGFIAQGGLADVVLEDPVDTGLDLADTGDGGLRLRARLTRDGGAAEVPTTGIHPIGTLGYYRIDTDDADTGDGPTLRLIPAAQQSNDAVQRLIERAAGVTVPAEERSEFLERVYPRLQQRLTVTSADESVTLPEFEPPTLRLQAHFRPDHHLQLAWSWLYFDPPREVDLDDTGALRDAEHEATVLAQAVSVWPRAAAASDQSLDGVAAARFSEHVLPQLRALDHVRVDIHGDRPDYRELTSAPHIDVGTRATQNDWFDLGVQVTVDGHALPFAQLFTALVQGKTTLILADGGYLALDHPSFDQLRALLSEAATLQEWTPERQQVSTHQVGFWEELKDLADEVEEDPAWTAAVGKLASFERLPDVDVPAGLDATLRPYQHDGFRWLAFLHSIGLGGILADDMGLGKTVQTLALLTHAREQEPDAAPFLVVAPSSVVSVWAAEARKFAPGLDVRVVDTTARKRGTSLAAEAEGADVVVTSYTLLRIDAAQYHEHAWSGLVLDEAQFIKNRAAKVHQVARDVRAPFRLAITGTPMENTLSDLWALLNVTVPGLFPNHRRFREEFVTPIETGEHPERMERLRRRLRPFMLRRSKELVAKDLPPKQEQVLHVELDSAHRKLYDRVLQRERRKVLGLLDDMDGNRFTIFKSLTLLRMLALAPQIVDGEYAGVPSSKMEYFLDELTEVIGEDHRVIVFSQFTSFLGALGEELDAMGVDYAYLDGSTRRRADVIASFREGDAPVFLISLKAGGFGLTLTEADYVFLMDPWWNPAAEAQAVDRAHRIGQDRTVMVYRLVSEGTIEEKVLEMQRRKAELFGALMDESDDSGAGAFTESLTADDIRELLGGE